MVSTNTLLKSKRNEFEIYRQFGATRKESLTSILVFVSGFFIVPIVAYPLILEYLERAYVHEDSSVYPTVYITYLVLIIFVVLLFSLIKENQLEIENSSLEDSVNE